MVLDLRTTCSPHATPHATPHVSYDSRKLRIPAFNSSNSHCALLTAHCSLLTAHCSPLTTSYFLHPVRYSLFTTHRSPLTAHYSPLVAHCTLLTGRRSPRTTPCTLLTARRAPRTTHWALLTAHTLCSLLLSTPHKGRGGPAEGNDMPHAWSVPSPPWESRGVLSSVARQRSSRIGGRRGERSCGSGPPSACGPRADAPKAATRAAGPGPTLLGAFQQASVAV